MEGLPRGVFDRLVRQLKADKYTKGFGCWDQLLAMVFAQLSGVKSLRELETAFNEQDVHHYHLGTSRLKRTTLADANAQRNPELYAKVCEWLMSAVHRKLRREMDDLLYLLDSSLIRIGGSGFDVWAKHYRNNVSQGLKLHLMIEDSQDSPVYARINRAQDSDIKVARQITLEPGATYVFDMGYYDFGWWRQIEEQGSVFVTRLKKNANVSVVERRPVSPESEMRLEDEVIRMESRYTNTKSIKSPYYQRLLRRVTVERPTHRTPLVLVSNDFERSAEEIAMLYKKRWGIELFFKWVKQNLKIKQFMGRSENAVKTQIYTALISYMLLQLYRKRQGIQNSLKLCLSALRLSLFQRPQTDAEVEKRRRKRQQALDSIQPQLGFP